MPKPLILANFAFLPPKGILFQLAMSVDNIYIKTKSDI